MWSFATPLPVVTQSTMPGRSMRGKPIEGAIDGRAVAQRGLHAVAACHVEPVATLVELVVSRSQRIELRAW